MGVHTVPTPIRQFVRQPESGNRAQPAPRPVLSVQAPAFAGSWSAPRDLPAGHGLRFGTCACKCCAVDVQLVVGPGHWSLGALTVHNDHWRLDNLTPCADLLVRDLEDSDQRLVIGPGRVGVVVPFELALVGFSGQGPSDMMTVFAHEPAVVDEPIRACAAFASRFSSLSLNPETGHVAVLQLLCLENGPEGLPTSAQIAEKLTAAGTQMTRRAVDHHIDYLFQRLFPHHADSIGRPGWKRAAIVAATRRTGIIDRIRSASSGVE